MAKPRTANSMYYYLPATAVRGTLSITTFASWGVWTAITTAGVGTHRAALPVIAAVTIVTTVAIGSTIIVAAAVTTTAVTTLATGATTIWTTARATLALQLGLRRHFTA